MLGLRRAGADAATVIGVAPGVGLLLAFHALAKRFVDEQRAFIATVVLATSSVFIRNTGVPRLEAPLALCFVGAIAAVLAGEKRRPLKGLFWVCVGIGVAVKGPGGLLPVGILAAWSLLRRRADPWNDRWFWLGLPALPLFVAPWLIANHLRFGEVFSKAYFVDDLEATALGIGYSNSPAAKYWEDITREWWPWIPFQVHGLWLALRRLLCGERSGTAPLIVAWTGVVLFAVFNLGRAYSRYLYPVLPMTALAAADSLLTIWPRIASLRIERALAWTLALGTAVVTFGPVNTHSREVPDIVQFQGVLKAQHALEPVLYLGDRVSTRVQAGTVFHVGTIARSITISELRARLAAGSGPIFLLAPSKELNWPADLDHRVLIAGDSDDLVEVSAAAPTAASSEPR